jgi:hypothetical protein
MTRSRTGTLILFVVIALFGFVYPRLASTAAITAFEPLQQRRPQSSRTQRRGQRRTSVTPRTPRIDYSSFSHRTLAHQKSCDACHKFPSQNWKEVRKGDAAFPDVTEYPQHTSCLDCHSQQFFAGAQPIICSVCHTNVSPRNGTRHPFPSMGEIFYASKKGQNFVSDFNINFPHDKHIELVGRLQPENETNRVTSFISASFRQEAQADKSCNVCHQTYQPQGNSDEEYATKPPKDLPENAFWLKKGAFKSHPLTHTACFTCHSQDSGLAPAPSDCNTCHKLSQSETAAEARGDFDPKLATLMGITDNVTLMLWRKREAGAFRHEWFSHAELSCASCHNVTTMNTLDEKTKKVPILSCGGTGSGCHITSTADEEGILNYVIEQRKANPAFQCTKCHIVFGKQPIPKSHLDALEAIKKK